MGPNPHGPSHNFSTGPYISPHGPTPSTELKYIITIILIKTTVYMHTRTRTQVIRIHAACTHTLTHTHTRVYKIYILANSHIYTYMM